jgi:hypothetical protein
MAEALSPPAVSLSRSQVRKTARHLGPHGDTGETAAETIDLKALARLVLADTRRDSDRDRVSRDHSLTEARPQLGVPTPGKREEGKTTPDIPGLCVPTGNSGNQSLAGVSVSRVVRGETPETPIDASPEPEPILLRDGGRLHRVAAAVIPTAVPKKVRDIMQTARGYGVRLFADGTELVVIEPWGSMLPAFLLGEIREHAGAMIAVLRGESRARMPG